MKWFFVRELRSWNISFKLSNKPDLIVLDIQFKGTLMQIWKSHYVFVFI